MREEDTVCVGSDGLQYCKVCGEAKLFEDYLDTASTV
jgi:uncharacterized protein (DUF983 family)